MWYVVFLIAYLVAWFLLGKLFEPRDIWVGVFWTIKTDWESIYSATNSNPDRPSHYGTDFLLIYVCLIPMFPIRFKFNWM